ncbi:MAG: Maf family protein [Eubacterium sp.]
MISKIQGKSHEVYTGVALLVVEKGKILQTKVLAEKTLVETAPMTPDEIQHYIQGKEPYDKAGGYGIQGEFARFVSRIHGDYNNVVGLPVHRVYEALKELGEF